MPDTGQRRHRRPRQSLQPQKASSSGRNREKGARLVFLPPYSPDLNPIEQVFAKLKHLLRKAAERTHEATWRRVGSLLECFSPEECAAYLRKLRLWSNLMSSDSSRSFVQSIAVHDSRKNRPLARQWLGTPTDPCCVTLAASSAWRGQPELSARRQPG